MMDLNGKRVLITGGHGFLGHHVFRKFADLQGAEFVFDVLRPQRGELDLLDFEEMTNYLKHEQPDIVIHLAAQCGGIGINRERPGDFLYNNLMMTTNLIECCSRFADIEKFVGVGTVCSYPKHAKVPFREEDLYNGYPEETNAPYGIAKRVQLEMLKAYRTQHNFPGIFLIPVNMLGEHDNFDDASSHVIPAMLKKFHHAKTHGDQSVTLWGDGSASREFLYAGDCAEAILRATLVYDHADPVNIGTGREIYIKDLAWKIREVVGYEGGIRWDTTKPNGQPRRCLDVSRARSRFGFMAQTNLAEALERTYKWAQTNGVLENE